MPLPQALCCRQSTKKPAQLRLCGVVRADQSWPRRLSRGQISVFSSTQVYKSRVSPRYMLLFARNPLSSYSSSIDHVVHPHYTAIPRFVLPISHDFSLLGYSALHTLHVSPRLTLPSSIEGVPPAALRGRQPMKKPTTLRLCGVLRADQSWPLRRTRGQISVFVSTQVYISWVSPHDNLRNRFYLCCRECQYGLGLRAAGRRTKGVVSPLQVGRPRLAVAESAARPSIRTIMIGDC